MRQIVDLQDSPEFQALGVTLVSIAVDPVESNAEEAAAYGVTSPLLSDRDAEVSGAYGVMQWAMPSGEPGHTFVLVDQAGIIRWIRDYGAPENGGLMYVEVDELNTELALARATGETSAR